MFAGDLVTLLMPVISVRTYPEEVIVGALRCCYTLCKDEVRIGASRRAYGYGRSKTKGYSMERVFSKG